MSKIEWTDETWNPFVGCSKISEGCRNCYAINQAARNASIGKGMENPGRLKYYQGVTEKRSNRYDWTGRVNFVPEALEIPLSWKKPRRVFVNSMSDLFHESVADEDIFKVLAVMMLTPRHTYQVLTKRPKRAYEVLSQLGKHHITDPVSDAIKDIMPSGSAFYVMENAGWTIANLHLGVTVENQKAVDERIPWLLKTPAAIRFLSCEPLLEPIDISKWLHTGIFRGSVAGNRPVGTHGQKIDWVIVGGESGPGVRPFHLDWARSIIAQCRKQNTPLFVKQLGAKPIDFGGSLHLQSRKGNNPEEWPEVLRVREFPKKTA